MPLTPPAATGDNGHVQTFVARAGQHMGGYLDEELRALYDEGHFLPTDNYWRDGMAEWSTLGDLFGSDKGLYPAALPLATTKVRSPARWIVPSVASVVLVIVGVFITVSYFSRKMAEAAAPVITPPPTMEESLPQLATGPKPGDLLQVPAADGDHVKNEESAAVSKDIQRLSSECRDAEKDMLLLGFDPARLTSLDEIEQRRQSIQIVLPRTQAVVDYLSNLDQKIRSDLLAKKVPADEIDAFIASLHRDSKRDALLKYWQQEHAISSDMLENLQMLRQNYGKWHLDGETVVFNDPAMLTAYRANVEKLKGDIATQEVAQATIKQTEATENPPDNP
jgi:hypothetical protein